MGNPRSRRCPVSRWKLRYQHKSALLVGGLFWVSLVLPAYQNNNPIIHGLFDTNVTLGVSAFLGSFFAIFVLSPVGLTHPVLLVGVIAQACKAWKTAALCGLVAFLLAATSFQFYEPGAKPNTWNHMTGTDKSKFRIKKLLPGFYCWWSCGLILTGAGLTGRVMYPEEKREADHSRDTMDPAN